MKTREALAVSFLPEAGSEPVEWVIADGPVGYEAAVAEMEARAALIAAPIVAPIAAVAALLLPAAAQAQPAHQPTAAPSTSLPHASPSVRKFARELGVPLDEVKGSGLKGRITESDIQGFTKSVMAGTAQTKAQAAKAPAAAAGGGDGAGLGLIPWPKVDFTKFGPVERFARADTSVTGQALKLVQANPEAILVVASGSGAAMPSLWRPICHWMSSGTMGKLSRHILTTCCPRS